MKAATGAGLAALAGAALFLAARSTAAGPTTSAQSVVEGLRSRLAGKGTTAVPVGTAAATDDRTALGRMLASESSDPGVRVVIGWITVERARRLGRTVYDMLTRGQGYGAQKRDNQAAFYASTAKDATADTLALAADLFAGRIQPSTQLRTTRPGSWVQRKQGVSDARIVELQDKWKEGLWAQLRSGGRDTGWVLYSSTKPVLKLEPGQTPASLLDGLPRVDATDLEVTRQDARQGVA